MARLLRQTATQIGILLLLGGTVYAQSPESWQTENRLFAAGLVGYGLAAVWDARTTIRCVGREQCQEANPVLRPFVKQHGITRVMVTKVAAQTAIAGFLVYERPRHRQATAWALVGLTAFQIGVDVVNYRRLERAAR